VVRDILLAWLLTFPGAGLAAAVVFLALSTLT
jgi:phosphate/sulfate permease